MAVRGIRANLLRSLLTTLGIAVGVGCVVTLIAYSAGNTKQLLEQFESFGVTSINISLGYNDGRVYLDLDDVRALRDEIPVLRTAAGIMEFQGVDIEYNGAVKQAVSLTAPESQFFQMQAAELSSGRNFSSSDDLSMASVCVIGSNVKDELFMNRAPLGQTLIVEGKPFEVIGVLAKKDEGMHGGGNNDALMIPPNTALVEFPVKPYGLNIMAEVKDVKYLDFAEMRIREILHQRHPEFQRMGIDGWDPLQIWKFNDWLKRRTAAANSMSRFLLVIGILCLTIGAVGVMNIMLVSVEERTLEIGLRKALGATRLVIVGQFLGEALIVCIAGGAIGLGVALVACAKMAAMPDAANVPDPILSQALMVGAILISLVIALAAGTWPAVLASSTDPIESLTYE